MRHEMGTFRVDVQIENAAARVRSGRWMRCSSTPAPSCRGFRPPCSNPATKQLVDAGPAPAAAVA